MANAGLAIIQTGIDMVVCQTRDVEPLVLLGITRSIHTIIAQQCLSKMCMETMVRSHVRDTVEVLVADRGIVSCLETGMVLDV
jgi:hypothetical protein